VQTLPIGYIETHTFTINETPLEKVEKFTYLGSTMTQYATLNLKLGIRLCKA